MSAIQPESKTSGILAAATNVVVGSTNPVKVAAVTAVLEHVQGVPPVVNDAEAIEVFRAAAEGAGLTALGTQQSLGGEDFAWYLRQVPGAMARLGTRTPGGHTYDLHQGDLVVDDDSVVQGPRHYRDGARPGLPVGRPHPDQARHRRRSALRGQRLAQEVWCVWQPSVESILPDRF